MTKMARQWVNHLIAVPKSLEAESPFRRLGRAEQRAAEAEREQTLAEREVQRQAHLIAMMLDQLGGELVISPETMEGFDSRRTIRTQADLNENSLRVWVEGRP